MIYILGSRGRLGKALAALHEPSEVVCVDREIYARWAAPGTGAEIRAYFASCLHSASVIYICSGLLDPRLSAEELLAVNYQLPRNIIEGVVGLGARVITFGTAMEHALTNNSYVQSKLKLSEFVEQVNAVQPLATHVRVHTQYGVGEPSAFMFLGQVLAALRAEVPFNMTSGRQLREYHHVHDDARAIQFLVREGAIGVVELSHGKPVTLRSLAEGIFDSFGRLDLLRVGAIPEPGHENFDKVFFVPESLKGASFRDANLAVVEYIKSRMGV